MNFNPGGALILVEGVEPEAQVLSEKNRGKF
jgi:hypothetical protein